MLEIQVECLPRIKFEGEIRGISVNFVKWGKM
jgi:hypothetical protein